MGEQQKIIIVGDVEGKFDTLFKKVEAVNSKSGPFDMLLCVGNFFGINNKEFEPYKRGFKKVPISTYILGPNIKEHVPLYPEEDTEICPNLTYLGKRGIYTSSGGVKIAYISGVHKSNEDGNHTYNSDDVMVLKDICRRGNPNFRGVDILLTSQWPEGIFNGDSNCKINTKMNQSTPLTSWLCMQIKPRYHISGLEGIFYERPFRVPTVQEDSNFEVVTRFVGLGRVGNADKQKWIYALSLTPVDKLHIKTLLERTTDETSCPFDLSDLEVKVFNKKRKEQGGSQYFYDMDVKDEEKDHQRKHKKQKMVFDQSKCWFCLSSPSVEKHLVITVGTSVYLALAKGAIVDEHFLICPIEHHQCSNGIAKNISDEIELFKSAIIKFYKRNGNVPVFFERNYKTSHMQIQAVPIPINATREIREIFQESAEAHGVKLEELESYSRLEQVIPTGVPYFLVELPGKNILYSRIEKRIDFPINFGREVLASGPILNLLDRMDWRDCSISKDEEETLVKKLRGDFEPYDISS